MLSPWLNQGIAGDRPGLRRAFKSFWHAGGPLLPPKGRVAANQPWGCPNLDEERSTAQGRVSKRDPRLGLAALPMILRKNNFRTGGQKKMLAAKAGKANNAMAQITAEAVLAIVNGQKASSDMPETSGTVARNGPIKRPMKIPHMPQR